MKKIILVFCAAFLFSCNSTKQETAKSATEVNKGTVKYEILKEAGYQGREEKSFEIIEENASLSKLYNEINETEIPKIDFSNSKVVALFLGQRNSGGYSIKVKSIEEKGGKVILKVEEVGPKSGEMALTVITNPFTIVKLNTTKEIVISE